MLKRLIAVGILSIAAFAIYTCTDANNLCIFIAMSGAVIGFIKYW